MKIYFQGDIGDVTMGTFLSKFPPVERCTTNKMKELSIQNTVFPKILTNNFKLLLPPLGFVLFCFVFVHFFLEICLYQIGNNKRIVFRKKLHTKRTTCIQLYNNSGQIPD